MIVTVGPDRQRGIAMLRFWALALVGLVIGHDAVSLGQSGFAAGVVGSAGHGYWLTFALLAFVLAGIPLAAASIGLARAWMTLGRIARGGRLDARGMTADRPEVPASSYIGELIRLFPRLLLVIVLGFAIQENLEHLSTGAGLPGLWVLSGPEYPLALPVLAAISLVLAVAGAWVRTRTRIIGSRLEAIRRAARRVAILARRAPAAWRAVAAIVAHGWLLYRSGADRAPPALQAA